MAKNRFNVIVYRNKEKIRERISDSLEKKFGGNTTSPLKLSCPGCHVESVKSEIEVYNNGEFHKCPHCFSLTRSSDWARNSTVLIKDVKKKKSKILDRLVVLKVCLNRMGTYSQIVSFFGIWTLVLGQFGISLWWLLGFIVLLPLGMWLDDRYVHSREIDFIFDKSEALGRSKKK